MSRALSNSWLRPRRVRAPPAAPLVPGRGAGRPVERARDRVLVDRARKIARPIHHIGRPLVHAVRFRLADQRCDEHGLVVAPDRRAGPRARRQDAHDDRDRGDGEMAVRPPDGHLGIHPRLDAGRSRRRLAAHWSTTTRRGWPMRRSADTASAPPTSDPMGRTRWRRARSCRRIAQPQTRPPARDATSGSRPQIARSRSRARTRRPRSAHARPRSAAACSPRGAGPGRAAAAGIPVRCGPP